MRARETSTQLLNLSQEFQNIGYGLDAISILLKISMMFETRDESKRLIDLGEKYLNQINSNKSKEFIQRKAAFLYLKAISFAPNVESEKILRLIQESLSLREAIEDETGISESLFGLGNYYLYNGDRKSALKFFKKSLAIGKEVDNKHLTSQAYRAIGNIYLFKGEFDLSLDYTNKSLVLTESIKNKCETSHNLHHLGEIYYLKGELDQAESSLISALKLAEESKYTVLIILCLYNLGRLLQDRGEFQVSLEWYEKALNLVKKRNAKFFLAEGLYNLIRLYTYHLTPKKAFPLIKELKELKREENTAWNNLIYRAGKALLLKTSKRLSDKMEALNIFLRIADEPCSIFKITVEAIINLCGLLLYELKITGNEELLELLDHHCNRLLEIADEQNSHSLLAETYWLQSKLALLKLNIQQAQTLLLKAQAIAEEKGLKALANSIGYDHYSFFSQLQKWEEYIDKEVSLNRRIELAQLEDLVVKMIYKQSNDVPSKTIEELMKIEAFQEYLEEAKRILSDHDQK
ncbi:MAG: tetratricopeptide repeat protein [Candidatus Hodarchaeales archaeon]